jgi:hypothetical protein
MRISLATLLIVASVSCSCLQRIYHSPIDHVADTINVGLSFKEAEDAIKAYGGNESLGHQEVAFQVTEGRGDRPVPLKWFDFKDGWTIQIWGRYVPSTGPGGEELVVSKLYYMPTNESDMAHSFGEQRERYKIESLVLKPK